MLLVIDAGNSNISFAVFNEAELLAHWRLATDATRSSDDYGVELRTLFQQAGIDPQDVVGIVVASVVPPLNETVKRLAEACFALQPLFVDHTTNTGLKINYDVPASLGADRIADAVGAVAKYGAPCIVVDFGTATTFNAVNAAGEFIGGAISPGLMMCSEALFTRTAKLPRVKFERPPNVIGTSTVTAIQSGLYHGYSGLVDRILEQMIATMGGKPHVIATGGLSPLIAAASPYIDQIDETLTLDGLRIVYERNKS